MGIATSHSQRARPRECCTTTHGGKFLGYELGSRGLLASQPGWGRTSWLSNSDSSLECGARSGAVNDLAVGGQTHLLVQTANATNPLDDPLHIEVFPV